MLSHVASKGVWIRILKFQNLIPSRTMLLRGDILRQPLGAVPLHITAELAMDGGSATPEGTLCRQRLCGVTTVALKVECAAATNHIRKEREGKKSSIENEATVKTPEYQGPHRIKGSGVSRRKGELVMGGLVRDRVMCLWGFLLDCV